jgi:beta-glucosidase
LKAATKINSWYEWFQKGHIKDGSDPSVADMHYERYQKDAQIMHVMGIRHYRLGIEWARLEPEPGIFDEAGSHTTATSCFC